MSSRRKISFSLYSECATISSRRLTSAWKLLVSWVMAAVACWRGRAEHMWRKHSPRKTTLTHRQLSLSHTAPPALDRVLYNRAIDLPRPRPREGGGGALRTAR